MDHVDVDGVRIAYRRRGTGPALVLLHGGLCDGRVWRTQLDALSDQFTVVAWDAPGCGGSADPPEHARMPQYAAWVARFSIALGLERPHVLGHSWGSTLALQWCVQHPGAIRSLVLVGAYAGWAGSLEPGEVAARLDSAMQFADTPSGSVDPASVPGLFSEAMPGDRRRELANIMSETRPAGTRAMARAMAETDLRDRLALVDVPTLLIHGADDERSPLHVATALHDAIQGSTLHVLPGAGHECAIESAAAFDAVVRRFLLRA